mgnify:FL=1
MKGYTLEIHDYGFEGSPVPAVYESPAENLVELQNELYKWSFRPEVIVILKDARHIADAFRCNIQVHGNTIIN